MAPTGSSMPVMAIEGVLQSEELRDFLYSKMRGGHGPAAHRDTSVAIAGSSGDEPSVAAELVDSLVAASGQTTNAHGDATPSDAAASPAATSPAATSLAATTDDADVSIEAWAIAAAYLGGTRPSAIAAARGVEAHEPDALRDLDAIFATDHAPWSPVFF